MEIKANPYVLTSEFDDLHLLVELCEKLKPRITNAAK